MAKAFIRSIISEKRQRGLGDLASDVRKEVESTLDQKIKPLLVKKHEEVVVEWESDVGFAAKKVITTKSITIYVYPTGKDKMVWIYVNYGTKPHDITPKPENKSGRLAFMWGGPGSYVPKTVANPPRVVYGGGYVKNPTLRRPRIVHHPGIEEPRLFTEQIAKEVLPEFRQETHNAFRRALRRKPRK